MKGFQLKTGALASAVAHDSHNVIAVGSSNADMCQAISRLRETNGGLVVVSRNNIVKELRLPIVGSMTDLAVEEVAKKAEDLSEATAETGCTLADPFKKCRSWRFVLCQN